MHKRSLKYIKICSRAKQLLAQLCRSFQSNVKPTLADRVRLFELELLLHEQKVTNRGENRRTPSESRCTNFRLYNYRPTSGANRILLRYISLSGSTNK